MADDAQRQAALHMLHLYQASCVSNSWMPHSRAQLIAALRRFVQAGALCKREVTHTAMSLQYIDTCAAADLLLLDC